MSDQNVVPGVKVVRLGLGEVVCNWGTHNGIPAVFLEPVVGVPGQVGRHLEAGEQAQIADDRASPGSVIIEIHSVTGLNVFLDDLNSALDHSKGARHDEDGAGGEAVYYDAPETA